jgi:GNAT superfamily N-acetyltransferase
MAITIDVWSDADMPVLAREEYARLRSRIDYGPGFGIGEWAPKTWHVLVRVDGALVGHVGLLERQVQVGHRRLHVAGVGGVWSVEERRGHGIGSAGMREAASFMDSQLGADAGLLLCRPEVTAFYERLGWQSIASPVRIAQSQGLQAWPAEAMILPVRIEAWPVGTTDLCGLPW